MMVGIVPVAFLAARLAGVPPGDDYLDWQTNQLSRKGGVSSGLTFYVSILEVQVQTLDVA
jgi:hypothetical protein